MRRYVVVKMPERKTRDTLLMSRKYYFIDPPITLKIPVLFIIDPIFYLSSVFICREVAWIRDYFATKIRHMKFAQYTQSILRRHYHHEQTLVSRSIVQIPQATHGARM